MVGAGVAFVLSIGRSDDLLGTSCHKIHKATRLMEVGPVKENIPVMRVVKVFFWSLAKPVVFNNFEFEWAVA